MSIAKSPMSTKEFAKKAGVSASTVSKWLRDGKIEGRKKNGKWIVSQSELAKIGAPQQAPTASGAQRQNRPDPSPPEVGGTVYTVEQFSAMTYLTEFGVKKWLKQGRLKGAVDDNGNPGVAATNLDNPLIQRLMR